MDEELELEQLARAPNAQAYSIEDQDLEPEACSVEPPLICHDDAMESLLKIQKSNLNDTKLLLVSTSIESHTIYENSNPTE